MKSRTDIKTGKIRILLAAWDRFMCWLRAKKSIAPTVIASEPHAESKPCRAAPRKIQKTLGDILDNVEDSFEAMELPVEFSHVSRDTRRALLRLGPWIPFGSLFQLGKENTVIAAEYRNNWPALMFMSSGRHDEWKDGIDLAEGRHGVIVFGYALKHAVTPWYVSKSDAGILYEFGMSYRYHGKLQWINGMINVNATSGETTMCNELVVRPVRLREGQNRGLSYHRREWASLMVEDAAAWGEDMAERDLKARQSFVDLFEWWARRNERWTVSVRREKRRVTWSIDQSFTKDFFKDRDRTMLTPSGSRKKIIHFVSAHNRELADGRSVPVKEHIRGLREFTWRGFQCAVTAPKFHTWKLQDFDAGAMDEDTMNSGTQVHTLDQLSNALAIAEDRQILPSFGPAHSVEKRSAA